MKEHINAEITGTEAQYTEDQPYKTFHPVRTYIYEMTVIAAIAFVVGTVLWWSWNR